MKQIPEELRPTCSCGEKMIIVQYKGYYDEFSYFSCNNCELDADDYEPDDVWLGDYAQGGNGMNKEKALEFLKEQKEYRLFGMDEENPSDFDKWQKNQADTYQRIIDWIEKRGGGMKKDKEWLKNEIEIMGSETSANYPHEQMVGIELVMKLIDQLDEPAKPSKPVIPKIVAEQLEYWKRNKMNILWQFFLREIPSSTLSWLESDAGNYDKLIDAEKNGYEVEKEKLYYIPLGICRLGESPIYLQKTLDGLDVDWSPSEHMYRYKVNYHFTEQEIKDYDERFWQFAVEVAE